MFTNTGVPCVAATHCLCGPQQQICGRTQARTRGYGVYRPTKATNRSAGGLPESLSIVEL